MAIFDDATQTQQDRTISSLFEQMRPELETIFSSAVITDLDNVFLKRPGPSLRHAVQRRSDVVRMGRTHARGDVVEVRQQKTGKFVPIPMHPELVRILAATNTNLRQAVREGRFREDLYYRLNVVTIDMPPLRERREDIPPLASHFLDKFARKGNCRRKELSPAALTALMQYEWPGNVRELENAIERAMVLGPENVVLAEDLPEAVLENSYASGPTDTKYLGALKENKRQLVLQAMEQANGQYIEAAKILGIHPNSLLRLIRNLGLKAAVKAGAGPPG